MDESKCEETCTQQDNIPQSNINRKLTIKEKYERVLQYKADGNSKSWICSQLNMDVRTYDKLIRLSEEEKIQRKMNDINELRELKKLGLSNYELLEK
ncbi:transposase [Bacillus sp. AR18-7]|uniref:transposase n=1 Tax=Bacillus sp. AR18-7 TaxID=2217821 RepID=UPI0021080D2B|nr:transposase [Bacillus sp. AR18-7]